jgi:hypothetical protein
MTQSDTEARVDTSTLAVTTRLVPLTNIVPATVVTPRTEFVTAHALPTVVAAPADKSSATRRETTPARAIAASVPTGMTTTIPTMTRDLPDTGETVAM